jgi:hypothetical protein
MTAPFAVRPVAAALLVAGLCLAALPGCGSSTPNKAEKKEEPKADPKAEPPKTDPKTGTKPPEPQTSLQPLEKAADDAATAFLRELGQGSVKAEMLSTNFLKSFGKPVELPSDKAKGYSADAAVRWLRQVGEGVNFSLSLYRQQAGDAAYLRGAVTGPRLGKDGGYYSLRLVKEGGAWKVDWVALSSAEWKGTPGAGTAEAAFQEFAAASFVEVLTDSKALPQEPELAPYRAAPIAAAMTPPLRAAWAPPFEQDKPLGYDYNPARLRLKAVEVAGGTSAFTLTRVNDTPEFRVELTRPAGKTTLTVKLVKGATPGEWLVSEVSEPKKG